MTDMIVRPPDPRDRAGWQALFRGYAQFYRVTLREDVLDRVWGWLLDPRHQLEGLLAKGPDGEVLGFAHFRAMPRTETGTTGCFLDDVYVGPGHRGQGLAEALLFAVSSLGRRRGWTAIRWVVAEDNYRARAVFDRIGHRIAAVTYEIDLSVPLRRRGPAPVRASAAPEALARLEAGPSPVAEGRDGAPDLPLRPLVPTAKRPTER